MTIINKKLSEIKPYEKNPRFNERAVDAVCESIREFGFKNPIILDAHNTIVCGHTRYRAAKRLGFESVPCIIADDLTDDQVKAFRLVDNKTAEFSDWDEKLLLEELEKIDLNIENFGFDLDAITATLFKEETPKASTEKTYHITYEIAFNTEEEQEHWYAFLGKIKQKYATLETISERILKACDDWEQSYGD